MKNGNEKNDAKQDLLIIDAQTGLLSHPSILECFSPNSGILFPDLIGASSERIALHIYVYNYYVYIYIYKTTPQQFCEMILQVNIEPFLEFSYVVTYHGNFRSSNSARRYSF